MTGMMCALVGSAGSFQEVVANGYLRTDLGKGDYTEIYGFDDHYLSSTTVGSLSAATFPVTNSAIKNLSYYYDSFSGSGTIFFVVSGTQSNPGWSTLMVGGTNYSRSTAGFSAGSTTTVWSWTAVANHFSGIASTVVIV